VGEVGAKPGNVLALRHGAFSERTVKRLATVQKRRLLRQVGLRAADLDGLGVAYLDAWARAQSKVELLDAWFAEHGFLLEDGSPAPAVVVYYTSLNCATRTLSKLEQHLAVRGRSPQDDLARYLNEHYGSDGDADG
jgi:hypothetical protein